MLPARRSDACCCWLLALSLVVSAECHVFIAVTAAKGFSIGLDVLAVVGELQARGHHVYVTAAEAETPYMERAISKHISRGSQSSSNGSGSAGKLTFVNFTPPWATLHEALAHFKVDMSNIAAVKSLTIVKVLQAGILGRCDALFSNATAIQVLRNSGADAVLTFGMPFSGWTCGCAVAHMLGVPLIAVDGTPSLTSPLNTPQIGSGLTAADLKTWSGYLRNLLFFCLKTAAFKVMPWLTDPGWAAFRAKHSLGAGPGQCTPTLLLRMMSFLLEVPHPIEPGTVLVGPVSPRLPRPAADQQAADPEVWEFLEGASPSAGVVLVGFGVTGTFGNALNLTDYQELAAGFSALAPTRVLWALTPGNLPEGTTLEQLPLAENVKVVGWVDYNDALGHPNTKVFVTHFGVHSKMEAGFHGVPTVGIPFQFEQAANGLMFTTLGLGEMCPQAVAYRRGKRAGMRFERNALRDLIRKVMTDPKYAEAAARVSAKLQLYYSYRTPVQRAADEVEVLLAQPAACMTCSDGALDDTDKLNRQTSEL